MELYCVSEKWDEGGNLAKTSLCFTMQPWETKEISDKNIFFSSFLSKHPWEDKGAGGDTLGKKGQEAGFLTRSASLAVGTEGPPSHRTCWLSLFLVDKFSVPQRLYGPRHSFCATSINANPEVFMHALFWSWQGSFSGRFLWLCSPLCWYLCIGAVHWLALI